jgi:hypothetical protein
MTWAVGMTLVVMLTGTVWMRTANQRMTDESMGMLM